MNYLRVLGRQGLMLLKKGLYGFIGRKYEKIEANSKKDPLIGIFR